MDYIYFSHILTVYMHSTGNSRPGNWPLLPKFAEKIVQWNMFAYVTLF